MPTEAVAMVRAYVHRKRGFSRPQVIWTPAIRCSGMIRRVSPTPVMAESTSCLALCTRARVLREKTSGLHSWYGVVGHATRFPKRKKEIRGWATHALMNTLEGDFRAEAAERHLPFNRQRFNTSAWTGLTAWERGDCVGVPPGVEVRS